MKPRHGKIQWCKRDGVFYHVQHAVRIEPDPISTLFMVKYTWAGRTFNATTPNGSATVHLSTAFRLARQVIRQKFDKAEAGR